MLCPTDVFDVEDSMSLALSATCICFACDPLSYSTETWPEADALKETSSFHGGRVFKACESPRQRSNISQKAEISRQGVAYHSTDIREDQKPITRVT